MFELGLQRATGTSGLDHLLPHSSLPSLVVAYPLTTHFATWSRIFQTERWVVEIRCCPGPYFLFFFFFFYLMDWRCLMVLWSCCCVYHLHNYMRHSVPSTSFDVELVRSGSNCIWTNLREYQSILAHRLCQNNCHQMFSVCFVKLFDLYYLTV